VLAASKVLEREKGRGRDRKGSASFDRYTRSEKKKKKREATYHRPLLFEAVRGAKKKKRKERKSKDLRFGKDHR